MKDIRELNISNLGFSFPRHTQKGFNVLVNYAGEKPITVKTPPMKCLYGVDTLQNKCFMKLTDRSGETDDTIFSLLSDIDERLLELPSENNWFENPDDAFYYTPHMQGSRVLRVQLPMKYSRIHGVEITNPDGEECTIGDITPGSTVICEIEWKNVWIIDQTFGYFWTVKKIILVK